jgi:signal transduction histidine kinase/CheY-like chemotaxis protein
MASRALVITPNRVDAELALGFLAEHGIAAGAYDGIAGLGGALPEDAGCVVVSDEALADAELAGLGELLARQPAWSDLPVILVAGHGAELAALVERAFPHAGNVTLLERPLNPLTLVSAVQVGLRARARQLEVRDLLAKREEALHQRDDFLAMLAHELRNPLAPMRNAVYLQKTLAMPDPAVAATRDILDRQVSHLSRIVDDLLDVARLERGKITLQRQRIELSAALRAAVEACHPVVQSCSHRLRMSFAGEPLPIEADAVRIEQLLTNLIVNACKFTPAGGEVELRTQRDGPVGLVSVRDNGVGIAAGLLESIFDPFAQADQTLARSAGGLGVGLSIARRIAELHGGSLRASSDGPNRGALFEARFPLAAAEEPRVLAIPRAATAARRRRILLVDDNADIRESLRMVLVHWGHEVTLASTGDEALARALADKPEVALVDIGLPGLSGYDVARRIRAQSPSQITLLALTGYGQPSDRERARDAGFDAHLLKPVDLERLSELLA